MQKRRLTVHHWLPGLLLAFTLCIFAPVDLYLTTEDELWFSLGDLMPGLGVLFLGVFVCVTLAAWLLPAKASVAFRAAVYAVTFLLYLQGNALIIDYGTLNGAEINWRSYWLPYLLDALLWIAVIALFIFLMFRFRKKFRRIVEIAACVLLITEAISLGVFLAKYLTAEREEDRYLSKKNEFAVSEQGNTIVFLLDQTDSHLFDELVRKYPDETEKAFADFTFYPNTIGGATRTKYAIPFIFTGDTNRVEQSYVDYVRKGFADSVFIRELATGKYDAGLYTEKNFVDSSRSDAIGNAETGTAKPSDRFGLTRRFMKLVLYRYAPNVFAKVFWMYTGDFESFKHTSGDAAYAMDDVIFLEDLEKEGLTVTAGKPAFRFYHMKGSHSPYNMDRDGERIPNGQGTEEDQTIGALRIVAKYLDRLKEKGLYDRATVIIMADHGFSEYSAAEQTPMFLAKLPGENHPFTVSELPLCYASLPEIFTAAVKGELRDMEEWQSTGTRFFYRQMDDGRIINLIEYAIDGNAFDTEPVQTGTVFHENSLSMNRTYTPGTVIWFDERDTGRGYIVSGFSWNEGKFTWTDGNDAELAFDLPEGGGALEIVLDHGTYNGDQRVEIYANEVPAGSYTAKGETRKTIAIPSGAVTGTELKIRLHLPDAVSPASLGGTKDERLLALSMKSLVIRKK